MFLHLHTYKKINTQHYNSKLSNINTNTIYLKCGKSAQQICKRKKKFGQFNFSKQTAKLKPKEMKWKYSHEIFQTRKFIKSIDANINNFYKKCILILSFQFNIILHARSNLSQCETLQIHSVLLLIIICFRILVTFTFFIDHSAILFVVLITYLFYAQLRSIFQNNYNSLIEYTHI